MRGASYFNLGNWSKALENLEEAQSIKRGNADTVLQMGIAHFKLGNMPDASRYLEQVLALDSGNQQAKRFQKEVGFRLAAQAISEKDSATAISLLEKIAAIDPQDGEAWFNLGLAHLMAEDLGGAENAFQKAGQFLPGRADVFDRLGYIYEVTNRYQEALQAYGKAHQLSGSTDSKASLERVQERIRRQNSGA
ncbi:MAG: tetratricopeptide repeat protein [Acidobacteriota bacterium]